MSEQSPLLASKKDRTFRIMPLPILSRSGRKFITGVLLLLCVVVLWTFSSFITSDLLSGGFDQPFLITYLNTASFTFYLLPFAYRRWRGRNNTHTHGYKPLSRSSLSLDDETPAPLTKRLTGRRSSSMIRSLSPSPALIINPPIDQTHPSSPLANVSELPGHHRRSSSYNRPPSIEILPIPTLEEDMTPLTTSETAKLAAFFCLAWMAANWSLNASLGLTSVGSSTILAGMSGFFTLGLGRLAGVETFTRPKVLAVLASFIGLLLVTYSDSLVSTSSTSSISEEINEPSSRIPRNPLLGDLLALLSASCYALYVILLKVKIGHEERVNMQLFFGFVGLFNTILLLPLIPILHVLNIERFHLPTRAEDWTVCAINMGITLSSDYIYVLAMLKTTPVVVTVGLSLTIPLAMLGDVLRGSTGTITIQSLIGAGLVLVGFGLMGNEGLEERNNETVFITNDMALEDDAEEVDIVSIDGVVDQIRA